jgi:hypothetical protein
VSHALRASKENDSKRITMLPVTGTAHENLDRWGGSSGTVMDNDGSPQGQAYFRIDK